MAVADPQEIEDAETEAADEREASRTGGIFAKHYLGPQDSWDGSTMPSPAAQNGPARVWRDER
jgi:hypothetical protein